MMKMKSKERLAEKFQRCGISVDDARMYLENFENDVKKYLKAFERWCEKCYSLNTAESYKYAAKYHPQPKTQEGIQELIRAIEDTKYNGYVGDYNRTGAYISHLVNKRLRNKNKIELKIGFPFNYLGIYTKKDWIIIGDVGKGVGKWMKGGTIRVIGNAGDEVGDYMRGGRIVIERDVRDLAGGWMEGGEIIVKGNAGYAVGAGKKGGRIMIKGNAKSHAGTGMEDGEIIVEGNTGPWVGEEMEGGRIIVKGKVEEWAGDGMEGGEIYVAYLDPYNLSDKIYGGNIYKGLPEWMGGKPELVVKDGEVLINK